MAESVADKQRENIVGTIPGKNGGRLRAGGKRGNKGGSGRPPKTFSTFMASLRSDADVQQAIRAAATDASSRGFAPVLKTITDYDPEKPKEQKELSGELVIRVVRDAE